VSWLRKAIAHLALARSDEALIKASGGSPRIVRGMTLDPRFQFVEDRARQRGLDWATTTPERLRAQTESLSDIFGGARVPGVRHEHIYIPRRSHSTRARLYLPHRRDNAAVMLVYFHSGGGVVGSLESCHRLCGLIAAAAHAPVLSIEYRRAPEHKFPAGLEDALAAYEWAVENASRFGASVRRAAVGGDSAGANFAAVIAQESRGAKGPHLQLLIYPWVDLIGDTPSMHEFADAFPLTSDSVDFYKRHYLPEGVDVSQPRLSPLRTPDLAGVAPAFVYTAGFDMLLDQGEAYADKLGAAGRLALRHRFEDLPHGFVVFPSISPRAELALGKIADDVGHALRRGAASKPAA